MYIAIAILKFMTIAICTGLHVNSHSYHYTQARPERMMVHLWFTFNITIDSAGCKLEEAIFDWSGKVSMHLIRP